MTDGKFIPYGRQSIDQADIEAVVRVLKSDYLTQGPAVAEFESKLADFLGVEYAIACANGTAALHLIALALGIGPGDGWITSPLTFVATANAARYVGATPVFADVDETGCLDPAAVPAAVEKARSLGLVPRVLAGVDLAGQPADWAGLMEMAEESGLSLVDDACHALGGRWRDGDDWRLLGDGKTALLTAFSFHPVKHVATGEGGAITTNDPALAEKLKILRTHGVTKADPVQTEMAQDPEGRVNPWYYEQRYLGFNYRLTDIQAVLGTSQLTKLEGFLARRRLIAKKYDQALAGLDHIKPLARRAEIEHAYHLYPVRIDFKALSRTRAQVMSRLSEMGIGTQVHYIPVHLQPDFRETLGTGPGNCPRAEAIYEELLSLPMYPALTDLEQDRVIAALIDLDSGRLC